VREKGGGGKESTRKSLHEFKKTSRSATRDLNRAKEKKGNLNTPNLRGAQEELILDSERGKQRPSNRLKEEGPAVLKGPN